jgi:hypothetical protein
VAISCYRLVVPAPFKAKTPEAKANTEMAAKARRRIGQETMARKLREAGWLVIPPEEAPNYPRPQPTPARRPADYVPYAERRPVTLPDSLDDLTGPTRGTVELPIHLDWSGKPSYNLDSPRRAETLYATVLTEAADPADLGRYLNRDWLMELWPTMWLPPKVRRLWEERFPGLAATRQPTQRRAI